MSYDHDDTAAACDMEFKWHGDDAWYSVSVLLDSETETLTVKFLSYPATYDSKFTADEFQTAADVDEFVSRFRPISEQLQDSECSKKIIQGLKVCAAYKTSLDDLRFYDAVVEAVHCQNHSFVNGEEECLCTFLLVWLHGPGCGNITSVGIESICIIEPADQVDPRIASFSKLAKDRQQGRDFSGLTSTSEGLISEHNQWRDEDIDIGGEPFLVFGSVGANSRYFILVDNVEKDLFPSSIKQFIHQQTTVPSQAYVFPSLQEQPFTRGAIVVDCRRKLERIYEFLNNPNHLIVSTRGRPWVMIEEASKQEMFGITLGSLNPICQDNFQNKRVDQELNVVHYGSEAYRRAKQLRDLFLAFVYHEKGLYNSLAFEEKRILHS